MKEQPGYLSPSYAIRCSPSDEGGTEAVRVRLIGLHFG